jgi:hypothetical protein
MCPRHLQHSSRSHPSIPPLPSSAASGELHRGGAPPWRPRWRRRLAASVSRTRLLICTPRRNTVYRGIQQCPGPRDLRHPRGRRRTLDLWRQGQAQLPTCRQIRRGADGQEASQGKGCLWRTRSSVARPVAAWLHERRRRLNAHRRRQICMLGLHTTVARGHIMVPLLPHCRGRRRR